MGSLEPSSLLGILQHSGLLLYSLGQLPALHIESLLADEMQDHNDMGKVFLGIPSGEDGHVEDGPIGKLDLEAFCCFLGGH